MHQSHRFNRPPTFQLVENQAKLMPRHFVESLVIDGFDGSALFPPANHTGKINRRPHARTHFSTPRQRGFINGRFGNDEFALHKWIYPPWTGGKKDTSSPSWSTWERG